MHRARRNHSRSRYLSPAVTAPTEEVTQRQNCFINSLRVICPPSRLVGRDRRGTAGYTITVSQLTQSATVMDVTSRRAVIDTLGQVPLLVSVVSLLTVIIVLRVCLWSISKRLGPMCIYANFMQISRSNASVAKNRVD